MKKLAIVSTHPIQYNAPLFALLSSRRKIAVKVFYTWSQSKEKVFDPGFGKVRAWDIPLLDGYEFRFVENAARKHGSHHFFGIRNPSLVSEIESWQPDCVLVFGWSFWSHLQCMRYFAHKRAVLFRGDSTMLSKKSGLKKVVRRLFLRWVYRHVDIAFYVGKRNKEYFLAHGINEGKLVLAPHAVDNDRFQFRGGSQQKTKKELRSKWKIDQSAFLILFVGKLEKVKNPLALLRIADLLRDEKVKFLIAGTGPMEAELKAAGPEEKFIFLGFQNQSEMPAVYQMADILLMPSFSETWGLAANEAMAAGLPVILSEGVAGGVDLVAEGENGIVFLHNDYQKVAEYVKNLMSNPKIYEKACENARRRIENFNYCKVARSIEETVLKMTK